MKFILSFILVFTALPLFAQNAALRQGNKAYDDGKFGQAFELYEKAADKAPVKSAYNKGAALYKLQDYNAAAENFENAVTEPANKASAKLNQNALYNLGNSAYKAGDKEKAKQAMRTAILLNLKDKDAIQNLQFMLKEEEANNNQCQQPKDNPQQDQEKDKKDKQQNQDKQEQDKQNQENKQQEQNKQERQEKETSAKEEAASVLQMAQEHKQNLPKQEQRSNQIEKDW